MVKNDKNELSYQIIQIIRKISLVNYDKKCTKYNVFGNEVIIYMRKKDELFLKNHLLSSDSLSIDCNYHCYHDCCRLVIKFCFQFSLDIISRYKCIVLSLNK